MKEALAMTNFNTLPIETQEKVKSILRAYDKAYVTYEYGEYKVSVGVAITATYAPDHKVIGTYEAREIFTEEERIENYVNSFNDYPIQYKGKRDYSLLRSGKEFKLVDGNIVKVR